MTIELFMPNIFAYCKSLGIKTIWRPNHEWIPIEQEIINQFPMIDIIMAPQTNCYNFMKEKFQLNNVINNPWIFNLPVLEKQLNTEKPDKTYILHNAGARGVGDRRNTALICQTMEQVLEERKDIFFILKSQVPCPAENLKKFDNFRYIFAELQYETNLELYKQVDFSLAPSKWEGVGFAILESLYCGTPVLTVNASPMNEWVQHKQTGYLCEGKYAEVELPQHLHGGERLNGTGWIKAYNTTIEEIQAGIYWLVDNKEEIYKEFNSKNKVILEKRKENFINTWKEVLK